MPIVTKQSKTLPAFFRNRRFIFLLLESVLSQLNAVDTLAHCLFRIYFNIIPPSALRSPRPSLYLRFSDQNFICRFNLPRAYYMYHSSDLTCIILKLSTNFIRDSYLNYVLTKCHRISCSTVYAFKCAAQLHDWTLFSSVREEAPSGRENQVSIWSRAQTGLDTRILTGRLGSRPQWNHEAWSLFTVCIRSSHCMESHVSTWSRVLFGKLSCGPYYFIQIYQ
jgi:hypothetical protein